MSYTSNLGWCQIWAQQQCEREHRLQFCSLACKVNEGGWDLHGFNNPGGVLGCALDTILYFRCMRGALQQSSVRADKTRG
jgi:hypothetical protein